MGEDALEHGHLGHRQELLGRGVGQGAEPGSFAGEEDDGVHFPSGVDGEVTGTVPVVGVLDGTVGVGMLEGTDV
jgi:hypothetical protein